MSILRLVLERVSSSPTKSRCFVDRIGKLRHWNETVEISDELLKYCEEKDEDTESELEDGDFDFGDGEDEMARRLRSFG